MVSDVLDVEVCDDGVVRRKNELEGQQDRGAAQPPARELHELGQRDTRRGTRLTSRASEADCTSQRMVEEKKEIEEFLNCPGPEDRQADPDRAAEGRDVGSDGGRTPPGFAQGEGEQGKLEAASALGKGELHHESPDDGHTPNQGPKR